MEVISQSTWSFGSDSQNVFVGNAAPSKIKQVSCDLEAIYEFSSYVLVLKWNSKSAFVICRPL